MIFIVIYLWISTSWMLFHATKFKNNKNFIYIIIFWPFLIPYFMFLQYFAKKKKD